MPGSSKSPSGSRKNSSSKQSRKSKEDTEKDSEDIDKPVFIYGGPFLGAEEKKVEFEEKDKKDDKKDNKKDKKDKDKEKDDGKIKKLGREEGLLKGGSPLNVELQGTFTDGFPHNSLKDRTPVILTKAIDTISKKGGKDCVNRLAEVKQDLITNKRYKPFEVDEKNEKLDSENAKKWNEWIASQSNHHYFTNNWLFTECYVYRKMAEACQLCNLENFDPFAEDKAKACVDQQECMCVLAPHFTAMRAAGAEEAPDAFRSLLKICTWSNKADLSHTVGQPVKLRGEKETDYCDPVSIAASWNVNLIVDESKKVKLDVLMNPKHGKPLPDGNLKGPPRAPAKKPKKGADVPPLPPKPPCPAKLTDIFVPAIDIVLDNTGYELFTDLCMGDFVLTQGWVDKIRYHVKKIPWFVSDVTKADFKKFIDFCKSCNYNRTINYPKEEGDTPQREPVVIDSQEVRELGARWAAYVDAGKFQVMADDFWVSPHVFSKMKHYKLSLYRQLQNSYLVIFKGDLNYRKLMGEINRVPTSKFQAALEGFHPAPLISLRTVKCEIVCGLEEGQAEEFARQDPYWNLSGNKAVIHYCDIREPIEDAENEEFEEPVPVAS